MKLSTSTLLVVIGLLVMLWLFANIAMGNTPDSAFDALVQFATATVK